ncbi:MAG TPA: HemK/PrmC family methyltransferase [Solirubrobacteraceae bacterium]|nr:HemK/PrmC family methyltransferase [Solirubrobacteraceae bacterium]
MTPDRVPTGRQPLVELLAVNGFVAAEEEADELLAAADGDHARLEAMVARRLTGEPLAWITGTAPFCGLWIRVDPGVYVPRWQSEPLAERAVERLPPAGVAVDVCCGSGAIARVLGERRPQARVLACDVDERAVACARANGVDAHTGDLLAPVPPELRGHVDVVVGVVPYVPTPELPFLQRDTFTFESPLAYDGGPDGLALARRVVEQAAPLLKSGGALLLEIGGDQAAPLRTTLAASGYVDITERRDEDGDLRGIEATQA